MENRAEPCNCLECLRRCVYFQRLSEAEMIQINAMKMAYNYRKGDVILKKGTYNPYIVLISQGYVKTVIEGVLDKHFILEIMGRQNFIAPSFTGDSISKSTLVALSPVLVCYIDLRVFISILENNGKFAADVLKYLNINEGYRFNRMMSISLKQTRGKVADALLYLNNLRVEESIFNYLSRKDLADMANISVENAIRTLKEFEQEGIIHINKKDIELTDPDTLKNISMKG
jgi:CRP-like cAMP-binding protein